MSKGVQRFPRTKMVLPLRVWLEDLSADGPPTQWAHTIDTSENGCRIGGLRTGLFPGQVITLQRGGHKVPFRVIWSRELEPHENQAGAEALDHNINIWSANSAPETPAAEPGESAQIGSAAGLSKAETTGVKKKEKSILGAARRRLRWSLGMGFVLFSLGVGRYLYFQLFPDSAAVAIGQQVPAPPTAEQLARIAPKPHPMPDWLSRPLNPSSSRLEVAEAPTGRVVYPVSPDDSIRGKVQLQIVIAANGLVKQIHVLSGKQPLATAAAEAVRLWRYASLAPSDASAERETSVTVSFLGSDAVSLEFPRPAAAAGSQDN